MNHSWLFQLGKWKNGHSIYQFLKFTLDLKCSFKAYEKNVKEKVTNCSLKTTEFLLNADGHVLT